MRIQIAASALVIMFSSNWVQSWTGLDASQQDTGNAAVRYLRADVSLRQSYALPTDAPAKLEKALDSPLDGEDEKLVASADDALIEFHHAAKSKQCDWAMSIQDGAFANTAHRGAIIELVAISGLRARIHFRGGDTPAATNDVLAAMAAARHLSLDGSLASVLFGYRLEKLLAGILAQNLARFSPAQLSELAKGLDALPPGSSVGTAFVSEKVRRDDFSGITRGGTSREELIEGLLKRIPILQSDWAEAAKIVDGCGGSVTGLAKCINQQHSFYTSWAPRFTLSPEQFEREYHAEIEEASKANPIIREFTPALPRLRWAEAYTQTRRAMLRSAIAVRQNGPSALNQHLDPYESKPLLLRPCGGWVSAGI